MSPKKLMVWRGVAWYVVEKFGNRWYRTVWLGPACRTNLGQCFGWWTRPDSNREPTDYESAALTIELRVLESHRSTRPLIHQGYQIGTRKGASNTRQPGTMPASTHRTSRIVRTSPVDAIAPQRRPRPPQRRYSPVPPCLIVAAVITVITVINTPVPSRTGR